MSGVVSLDRNILGKLRSVIAAITPHIYNAPPNILILEYTTPPLWILVNRTAG